ncbi:MAG TPA: NADH-quinone oxidoreductase subunit NuoE [Xanthobacteraceae bacterium]|nr:NADH-quinone oxidoreductase subunit NuoE [Xanthobacteraceae bacterium]
MAVRRLAPKELQPASFAFTEENLAWAKMVIDRYPAGRQASAVIPVMWRAQEQQGGWLTEAAIRYIADMLGMPYIRALEVATFYTQFQLQPVGKKAHVQVCGTTPCLLRGAADLIDVCKRRIHPEPLHLSEDGDFSWEEVECQGACVNAPMAMVWKDTYEDLTVETFEKLIDGFASGNPPKAGPQNGRHFSAPLGGPTTLKAYCGGAEAGAAGEAAPAAADATKKGNL